MKKKFALTLTALSPLSIRADHAADNAETMRFISGSTLLGSLAAAHRMLRPDKQNEFVNFFLGDYVHFPFLYPAYFASQEPKNAPIYPTPTTAQSCKRFPGFRRAIGTQTQAQAQEDGHGVRDNLFDWAIFELACRAGCNENVQVELLDAHSECSHPYHAKQPKPPLERFERYYRYADTAREAAKTDLMRVQAHTGINRDLGTVEEGILYSRQVFEEGMRFWGSINVDDALEDAFSTFLTQIESENGSGRQAHGLVRIGTGRTRGMGKVQLETTALRGEAHTPEKRLHALQQRLKQFDKSLRERVQVEQKNFPELAKIELARFYLALTLHTPTILCDELLRYRGIIDKATLAELIGQPIKPFELIYSNASVRRVTGWQELWGTPKTNDYAIDTGSVFLFALAQPPGEKLLARLLELEEQGIGRRRAEGFGRVYLSDPFHCQGELA